jgi:hypothetical protein
MAFSNRASTFELGRGLASRLVRSEAELRRAVVDTAVQRIVLAGSFGLSDTLTLSRPGIVLDGTGIVTLHTTKALSVLFRVTATEVTIEGVRLVSDQTVGTFCEVKSVEAASSFEGGSGLRLVGLRVAGGYTGSPTVFLASTADGDGWAGSVRVSECEAVGTVTAGLRDSFLTQNALGDVVLGAGGQRNVIAGNRIDLVNTTATNGDNRVGFNVCAPANIILHAGDNP